MTRQIQYDSMTKPTKAELGKLTVQQRQFVDALLATKDFNVTEAARSAGYAYPSQAGHSLLKKEPIQKAVGWALKERSQRLEWEADDVLETLRTVVSMDVTQLYDMEGNITMKAVKDLPEHLRRCISKVKSTRKYYTNEMGEKEYYNDLEVEFMSKDQALQLALKHFGLLNDELNIQLVDDKLKRQVVIDILGQLAQNKNVIDSTAVDRLALESPDVSK